MALKKKKQKWQPKFIFVTGGVVSSIGKGLTAASLGTLLESQGFKIALMKCDPYINVDPGTMSPFQHGEVYVTDDGAETDLDLGHYERFTQVQLTKRNSITAGQVYESVIQKERRGDYLGGTVQVIPHITDQIKLKMFEVAQGAEITIVEIGGTVGDIEGLPFIEAIRQMRVDLGFENTIYMHVTYVPYIAAAGELKSKPTQHSVKELRAIGIQPDFLICRTEKPIDKNLKDKIGLFCSVVGENVIAAQDSSTIYEVPLALQKEKLDQKILARLGLKNRKVALNEWKKVVRDLKNPKHEISIGIVGKYVDLIESYKSLNEAIIHGGLANSTKVNLVFVDSENLNERTIAKTLSSIDGILVPGGFGERGVSGKMLSIKYARENQIPFFGICFGMQIACIEFAKNVCGIEDATSREFIDNKSDSKNLVIDFMEEQRDLKTKGGTMRLGSYSCDVKPKTKAYQVYKKSRIQERHRHRYEYNNKYKGIMEKYGMVMSGICKERDLVEIIEIPSHPYFIGVQFHPEFKSKPTAAHPLFSHFVAAALKNKKKVKKKFKLI